MDIIELLNELAELQASDFKAKKRDELRKILTTIVVGESVRISKLKKDELIQEIQERIADYKETLTKAEAFDKVVPDLTDEELENFDVVVTKLEDSDRNGVAKIALETYEEFRAIAQRRYVDGVWLEYPSEMSDLANQLAARLEAKSEVSTTILKYRSDCLNAMQELLEIEKEQFYFEQLWRYLTGHSYEDIKRGRKSRGQGDDCQPCFSKSLYKIWKFTHAAVKGERDKAQTEAKEMSFKTVNIGKLLEWANGVLTNLRPDETNRKLWRSVSVAIAVATGRRQVEVHCTGSFEFIDEYHVAFTGQAKTRGKASEAFESEPSYIIPTLLNAESVVKGHEWLKANSGKFYGTEKEVNDNVNRDANRFLKEVTGRTVEVVDGDGQDISKDVAPNMTYHDLREIYALASYEAEGCKTVKRTQMARWITEVLGEDRGGTGKSSRGSSTAARYMDEYEIQPGTPSRI